MGHVNGAVRCDAKREGGHQQWIRKKVNRTDEMEIDLRELFYLFRQKLLIIIAAFVVGGMLAGAATYFLIKPTYKGVVAAVRGVRLQ